ncbi:MAG: hypothetical protein ACE5GD_08795 [Candidatus Geothermarchaeales archaeon]
MFHSALSALKLINDFTPVEIVLMEDILDLDLVTFSFPPSRKGDKVRVPLWLARHLESKGVAAIDSKLESEWLGRIHWREKVKPPAGTMSLSTLPDDFYAKASNILHALTYYGKDPYVRQTMGQVENLFRDVLKRRVRVISEMSLLDVEDPSFLEKLTFEERILLGLLKKILDGWRREVGESHLVAGEGGP